MEKTRAGTKDVRARRHDIKLEAKARIIRVLALTFLTVDIVFYITSKLLFWLSWIDFSFDHAYFEGTGEVLHAIYSYIIIFIFVYRQLPLGIFVIPFYSYLYLVTGLFLYLSAFSNTGLLLLFCKVWLVNYILTALFLLIYVVIHIPLFWLRYKEKKALQAEQD